jgi:hypothetical protein
MYFGAIWSETSSILREHFLTRSFTTLSGTSHLLTGFSAVGSLLTLVGIYGMLSLSVASRRKELAIRSAMGSSNCSENTVRPPPHSLAIGTLTQR